MSYYPNISPNYYNSYSPVSIPTPPMQQYPMSPYPYPPSPSYMPYYNYYREPNVLNRLLNRTRYGTGSYFGNPYLHTRVTFDPQGNRIWPEGNYVSSVKDLWKTSDPYASP
ncbi:hypothetical protein BCR42DRAFT_423756 [Absidia repens]|uniref:Uncharacterized protein n=1 Tax=Absidia repens TaxID=90262 RepID=A0A1X2I583_9FUNG|nr:hypothetical protein BCR42DRAFT_423756 [Absidia repens]